MLSQAEQSVFAHLERYAYVRACPVVLWKEDTPCNFHLYIH